MSATASDTRPVTVVFTWDVTPGCEAEFESWAHGVNDTATGFPGHRGATWLRADGCQLLPVSSVNLAFGRR